MAGYLWPLEEQTGSVKRQQSDTRLLLRQEPPLRGAGHRRESSDGHEMFYTTPHETVLTNFKLKKLVSSVP